MKRLPLVVLLSWLTLLPASVLLGQSATLNTPEAHANVTKILVVSFRASRDCTCSQVVVEYQTAASAADRQVTFNIPANPSAPGTENSDFLTAIAAPRATETGVVGRRMNFRILGYLSDAGRLTGVTLVP